MNYTKNTSLCHFTCSAMGHARAGEPNGQAGTLVWAEHRRSYMKLSNCGKLQLISK